MKNFLASLSKGVLFFLGGMLFTMLIMMVLVVFYLFNENNRLQNEMSSIKNKLERMDSPIISEPEVKRIIPDTIIEEEPAPTTTSSAAKGISWGNWSKLRNNMSDNDVVALLGNPTQIISKIDTTTFIYKDSRGEGAIEFNRGMRVVGWSR